MAAEQEAVQQPGAAGREPEETRRRFLDAVMSFGFVSTALSIVYPVARYLVPPAGGEPATLSAVAGKVAQLPPNSGAIFKLGSKPGIIVRDQAGEFHAFSAICTHQGCDLKSWSAKEQVLVCFCHSSKFKLREGGAVASGPAQRALPHMPLKLDGEQIVIAGG